VKMTWDIWQSLSPAEKDKQRDLSGLAPQLVGLEGWRVEVTDENDRTRRFIVSRSSGWRPCHIALMRRDSTGGHGEYGPYKRVRQLYRVWNGGRR
jgi:hypothetical protein